MTPGKQKRGKAAKQAIEVFSRARDTPPSHKGLIKGVTDSECVQAMIGDVKVAVAGLAQATQVQATQHDAARLLNPSIATEYTPNLHRVMQDYSCTNKHQKAPRQDDANAQMPPPSAFLSFPFLSLLMYFFCLLYFVTQARKKANKQNAQRDPNKSTNQKKAKAKAKTKGGKGKK